MQKPVGAAVPRPTAAPRTASSTPHAVTCPSVRRPGRRCQVLPAPAGCRYPARRSPSSVRRDGRACPAAARSSATSRPAAPVRPLQRVQRQRRPSSRNRPTRVRRSASRCAPQPSDLPDVVRERADVEARAARRPARRSEGRVASEVRGPRSEVRGPMVREARSSRTVTSTGFRSTTSFFRAFS